MVKAIPSNQMTSRNRCWIDTRTRTTAVVSVAAERKPAKRSIIRADSRVIKHAGIGLREKKKKKGRKEEEEKRAGRGEKKGMVCRVNRQSAALRKDRKSVV